MSNKKNLIVLVLFLAGFLAIAIPASGQFGTDHRSRDPLPSLQPEYTQTPSGLPPIQPTASSIETQELKAVPFTGLSKSALELNRVLGIPIEDLEKMTSIEIDKLMIENADRMGIVCYEEKFDELTKQYIIVQTCGTFIFRPESHEGYVAPTATPNPIDSIFTPTPGGYPVPQSNTATEKTVAVFINGETTSGMDTKSIDKIYLPLIVRSDELHDRIGMAKVEAKHYIDKLYQDNTWNGFIKEYPGIPLSIKNSEYPTDYRSNRFLGHYYQTTSHPVGYVATSSYYGYDYDVEFVSFEEFYDWSYGEPNIRIETTWTDDLYTHYYIQKLSWTGTTQGYEDLYFGDLKIWEDVYMVPNFTEVSINAGIKGNRPANRFTIRHATKLGTYFYDYYTDPYKVQQLNATVNVYGFNTVPDIYAPLFGKGTSAADNFMFTNDAYHDCDLVRNGMDSTITFGYMPHRYPYESKACISRLTYINLSKVDYLATGLQALHILNKYHDPDHQYSDPRQYGNTTPRLIARWLETKWNGYGIPAYLKDAEFASSLRTNVFVALEAKLGYEYNDLTSRYYADMGIEILLDTQVGIGYNETIQVGEISTAEGYFFRPNQTGSQLLSWYRDDGSGEYYYVLSPKTFLTELVDLLGMPNETLDVLVSNAETTMSYWAALNTYEEARW